MTQDDASGDWSARQIAHYDRMEHHLHRMIETPHWKFRRSALVLDNDGQPVPDPAPARKALRLLDVVRRDRARFTGQALPAGIHKRTEGT